MLTRSPLFELRLHSTCAFRCCSAEGALDVSGLSVSSEQLAAALRVDASEWLNELPKVEEHFAKLGDHLPAEMSAQLQALRGRLTAAAA